MNNKEDKFILTIEQPDGRIEKHEVTPFEIPEDEVIHVMRLRDKDGNIMHQFETTNPRIINADRIEIKKDEQT